MPEMHLCQRSEINVREVDDETVIVDKVTGEVHQLNSTASYIWEQFSTNNTHN